MAVSVVTVAVRVVFLRVVKVMVASDLAEIVPRYARFLISFLMMASSSATFFWTASRMELGVAVWAKARVEE